MSKVITLPPAGEMLARLRSVLDNPHVTENFYPLLTREAGNKKNAPEGIQMMLVLAIYDYAGNLRDGRATEILLTSLVPEFTRVLSAPSEDKEGES